VTCPYRLDPMIMMDEVANFQMLTLAGCGLPLNCQSCCRFPSIVGLVWFPAGACSGSTRYAIVLAVVLGGVLTPSTDPFTQCLLAGTVVFGLYNLSILVVLADRACASPTG